MLGNGLIDKSGAILISGPQKVGKSLFGTQLALSLAAQRGFLGFEAGAANYRTLILQAEVAPQRMKERFVKQVAGFDIEAQQRVLSASVFSQVKLDTADGIAAILGWIEEHRPNLLIIDPLSNFHSGDENQAQDMSRITNAMNAIRDKEVAVVLVHHHGKGSGDRSNVGYKSRGSSVLPGWYDSHFSLEWAELNRTVRLRFELRHGEALEDRILRLNRDTLQFEVQNDEASQVSLVATAVAELGQAQAQQVADVCRLTRQWAERWLNQAVEDGRLVRTGRRPVIFSLPGEHARVTRMEIPTAQGQIIVSTNTAGGLDVEEPELNWMN